MFNNFITNSNTMDVLGDAILNLDKKDQDLVEKAEKHDENDFDDIEDFEDDFGEFDAMAEARKELRLDGSDEDEKNPWDWDEEDEDELNYKEEEDKFYDYEYLDDDEDKYGNPIKETNKRNEYEEDDNKITYNPFIGGIL